MPGLALLRKLKGLRAQEFPIGLLASLFWIAVIVSATPFHSIAQATEPTAPILTLDEAVSLALKDNRPLRVAEIEIAKGQEDLAAAKTRRLPSLGTSVLGSQLLTPIDFTFQQGAFGTYPGIGPIPATDTDIRTPLRPVFHVEAEVDQPLSQLYKIHLGLQAKALAVALTREQFRAARQQVANGVKQAYYAVLQEESALSAAESSVKHYEELDRVVVQRVAQETALKSDGLDVKAKLAEQRYKLIQSRNRLQSRKEALNNLLGRDIRTDFRVQQVPAATLAESSIETAQQTALSNRPEIKQAEITRQQAEYGRRLAKAEYVPDVGIAFRYISSFNVNLLPSNIAMVGVQLKWEPWDWGRRRHEMNLKKLVVNQSDQQLQETRNKVLLEVNDNFRKLQESRLLLDVADLAREAAREKLRVTSNRYEQNAALLSEVLQQTANLTAAEDNYRQVLLAFWTAKANLERSLGEDR